MKAKAPLLDQEGLGVVEGISLRNAPITFITKEILLTFGRDIGGDQAKLYHPCPS
jgi:hypothetical protein